MSGFLTAVIVISAVIITIIVIMQPSKDGGLGGLASGGVTDSVFGANRNEFLAKATWWLLAIFIIASVTLAKNQSRERAQKDIDLGTGSAAEGVSAADGKEKGKDIISVDSPEAAAKAIKDALDAKREAAPAVEDAAGEKVEEVKKKAEEVLSKEKEELKKAVDGTTDSDKEEK
jgi:preprotein translocase subunit SecG